MQALSPRQRYPSSAKVIHPHHHPSCFDTEKEESKKQQQPPRPHPRNSKQIGISSSLARFLLCLYLKISYAACFSSRKTSRANSQEQKWGSKGPKTEIQHKITSWYLGIARQGIYPANVRHNLGNWIGKRTI